MQQKKLLINTILILLVVAGLAAAYFYIAGPTDEEIGLTVETTEGAEGSAVSAETSEFLILLRSLQTVDLSGEIFRNKIFASDLVNFTTEIAPRAQGRSNPFAPLGTANIASDAPAADEAAPADGTETASQ